MTWLRQHALPILFVVLCLQSPLTIYAAVQSSAANHALGESAKKSAHSAGRQAQTATLSSQAALVTLQAEASGECYRVDYLRWNVDRSAYDAWLGDLAAVKILQKYHIGALARAFRRAARNQAFLPLTDCAAATRNPETYRPPTAVPFAHVPRRVVLRTLLIPPSPPGR